MVGVVLFLSTGCGGFNATPAFSPLMFFMPGLANTSQPTHVVPPQTATGMTNGVLAKLN
jgi:hypothetical protein